jgi:hypothetical protein
MLKAIATQDERLLQAQYSWTLIVQEAPSRKFRTITLPPISVRVQIQEHIQIANSAFSELLLNHQGSDQNFSVTYDPQGLAFSNFTNGSLNLEPQALDSGFYGYLFTYRTEFALYR